ncbi:sensor histidine kinase [Sphingobium sp.]|uniref:sensor histidine kinase n=1 Tax=Sphingobium sp. TaxID=1912891 RepID=UPI003B3B4BA0
MTVLPPTDVVAHAESDHRIANNLGLLASLLELDSRNAEDAGSPDIARILDVTRRRIYAVANIHRRLCQSDREGFVDLASYLEDLGHDLQIVCQDAGGRRSFSIDAESRYVEAGDAVSVGILVAELVSNACKHAYCEDQPGEIRILLKSRKQGWQLMVEDDGVGFGQSPERSQASIGAYLIDASAANLGAAYVWQDSFPGTRFILWKDEAQADDHWPFDTLSSPAASGDGRHIYS